MNSNLMGARELSGLLDARYISFSSDTGFSSVAIDSRAVLQGALFFALPGASCDGHGFVAASFNAGAAGAVVEESKLEAFNLENIAQTTGKYLIITKNTLKALQDTA